MSKEDGNNLKDEQYISKQSVIKYSLWYFLFYIILSISCIYIAVTGYLELIPFEYFDLFLFIMFVLIPLIFSLFLMISVIFFVKEAIPVLLGKKKITEEDFYKNIKLLKPHNKNSNRIGVEGIIDGKEFESMDKDRDGQILISEFYPKTETEVLEEIRKVDVDFSKTEFYSYVKSIFSLVQKAFVEKNYRILRSIEEDSLYHNHKALIEMNNKLKGKVDLNVKGILLKDFKIDGSKQVVVCAITIRMFDGNTYSKKKFKDIPLIMTFTRNNDFKKKSVLSTTNCCNCGAVIDVDDNGICKYCGTSLVFGKLKWVLVDIKRISLINEKED